jgi:hypothetical protein
MSTSTDFQDMLNEYLPNPLLKEEFVKRDYVYRSCEKDESWGMGTLIVPFRGAQASSVKYGGLTSESNIASSKYVRGEVSSPKEVWGTLLFKHRDLMEHGKISEQNFLRLLPDEIEDFMDYMKSVVSCNFLKGEHFAKAIAAAAANDGKVKVDRPDMFTIGQLVQFVVADASTVTAYVKAIDINTQYVTFETARGNNTNVDFSAGGKSLADGAKMYNDSAVGNSFSSMKDALLSATNGGSASLYGQTKTAYTYLQAINISGADITSANIVEKIFDALVKIRLFGKGAPSEVLMSITNLGHCMKVIESQKGGFNVVPDSQKASQYGWMEISVGSPTKAPIKLVGINEADDDAIMFVDWRGIKFYSNGGFQKRKSPDGKEYFEIRATTGYSYIVDICLFGELVVQRPSYCGILFNVDVPAAEGVVA